MSQTPTSNMPWNSPKANRSESLEPQSRRTEGRIVFAGCTSTTPQAVSNRTYHIGDPGKLSDHTAIDMLVRINGVTWNKTTRSPLAAVGRGHDKTICQGNGERHGDTASSDTSGIRKGARRRRQANNAKPRKGQPSETTSKSGSASVVSSRMTGNPSGVSARSCCIPQSEGGLFTTHEHQTKIPHEPNVH